MPIEEELPRLLREAGIATQEQADALADGIAEVLAADNAIYSTQPDDVRGDIRT